MPQFINPRLSHLYNLLQKRGFYQEVNLILKLADKRGNMIRLLHLSPEEADFFHNLDPQKSYTLARWFAEYKKESPLPPFDIKKEFDFFQNKYTIESEGDYQYDQYYISLIETVRTNDDFYRKVKNDSLQEAWKKLQKEAARGINFGEEIEFKHPKYKLFEGPGGGPELSAFMSHCGTLGELDPDMGEYGSNHQFCMLVLTDRKNIPKMTATVGELNDPITFEPVKVIVNASLKANRPLEQNPEILKVLIDWAKKNNYQFAHLFDKETGEKIWQTPGIGSIQKELEEAGFKIKNFKLEMAPSQDENQD